MVKPDLKETLNIEMAILEGCIHSAICYLEEAETPFEQKLAMALQNQQYRVDEVIEKIP